jgi:hypothetical protein
MPRRRTGWLLLLGLAVLASFLSPMGWADPPTPETIQDRAGFIPNRKHMPLKGKAIGILLTDGQPVLTTEGRSGPPDQLCFATAGASYRWVYVPAAANPQITNLQVPVGDKGETQTYPALDMANPKSVTPWGISRLYSLVEVEVNNGKGSPAGDSFVATRMTALDGTREYPLKLPAVVADLRKRFADYEKDQSKSIETAMAKAAQEHLQGRKPTGPQEKSEVMFLTWLPESQRLRAHFRVKLSDGAYQWSEGGIHRKFPLPPPPLPPKGPGLKAPVAAFPPPPPPPRFKVRYGTTFGIDFGVAYEVSKEGEVLRTQVLPIQSFRQVIPPPPVPRRPIGRGAALELK